MTRTTHIRGVLFIFVVLSIGALMLLPFVGAPPVGFDVLLNPAGAGRAAVVYWHIRLPRCIMAFLAGAGLSAAGMVFQCLFQNALASPFTLGVTGGASFAAALYVKVGLAFNLFAVTGLSLAAFVGALVAMILVLGLSKSVKGEGPAHVLLAGLAVNFSFTGAISFVQYLSDYSGSFRIIRWLMGGLEVAGFESVVHLLPPVLIGIAATIYFMRELNLITTGEEVAMSRGVNVAGVKQILFVTTSLMVGGVVSFCGPIGFVGIMAPHIARLFVGSDHRYLIPASILFGGLFLTLSDTVARLVISPAELPVGVMTSLFGGPFFLWLLIRNRGRGTELG